MKYSIYHIAQILNAAIHPANAPDREIEYLITDSRHIVSPANSLFFALKGPNRDGHDFIAAAYGRGVRSFIVERIPGLDQFPGACFLSTSMQAPIQALQNLAATHRARFNLPVIGITGSNGKTVVKEWLYRVLSANKTCIRSPRSYNSQTGVPLSVWQIEPEHEIAIFEAGISRPGEMQKLEKIIRPDMGIFTNIGPAHDAGFRSREEKIAEKLLLFQRVKRLIYRKENPLIEKAVEAMGCPVFSWSTSKPADLQIQQTTLSQGQTRFEAQYRGETINASIPFTDEASIENALHVWAAALALEVPQPVIEEGLRQLEPIEMRLELREGINGCTLINDSYNSDFQSLSIALHFLTRQRHVGAKTLFLSDFLEIGIREKQDVYQKVAGLIKEEGVGRVYGIGREVVQLGRYLPDQYPAFFFPSTEAFLAAFRESDFFNESILLKGARPFAFERIARRLQPHTHRTLLEVNLAGIAANLQVFQKKLSPGVQLMVMVKAAAYGSGSLEIARLLAYQGVHYLAVAYADEGVDLRRNGIHLPILVLNPEPATFDALVEYNLEPEIYSLNQLKELGAFAAGKEIQIPVHLKLDTGMHRLGFEPFQTDELIRLLNSHSLLVVKSVFTHLAASDSPEFDGFTHRQMALYLSMFRQIETGLGYRPLRHALNTGGISRFPNYQMDMVRLGIGLYGLGVGDPATRELSPALTLKATVSQIRELAAGETVSYSRSGKINSPRKIATLSLGYADGLARLAGNGRFKVKIRDKAAPTVGNICMDMTMVDVTEIPDAAEGDIAVIFGPDWPVESLASAACTISYEIIAGISGRVKRVYIQE